MRDFVARLDDKQYAVRFVPLAQVSDLDTGLGSCRENGVEILINRDLSGDTLMDVLIHECIHACLGMLTEEVVSSTASEIAAVLSKAGYKQVGL